MLTRAVGNNVRNNLLTAPGSWFMSASTAAAVQTVARVKVGKVRQLGVNAVRNKVPKGRKATR